MGSHIRTGQYQGGSPVHSKHPARRLAFLFGVMVAVMSESMAARAEDDAAIIDPAKGQTIISYSFSGTQAFAAAQIFQLNYLHGFSIGERKVLFSHEAGFGFGSLYSGEDKIRASLDASMTALVMLEEPDHACHSHVFLWENGFKAFALSNSEAWPLYAGPSFGFAMMTKVHHNSCYSSHNWSAAQDVLITRLSYMALWNANPQDSHDGVSQGAFLSFSW